MRDEENRMAPQPAKTDQEGSWSLGSLPWPEVGRSLALDPRLLIPVGALIQHGPHLPLGTNTLIAERVAQEVSRRTGILLAPTFPYGVGVPGKEPFAGSAGLRRKTLHRALNELLAEWENHGVEEFIILTAHRYEPHLDALLMAMTASATATIVNLYAVDVDDLLQAPPESEHGGELETSLLLFLAPQWVRHRELEDVPPGPGLTRRYSRGGRATPPPGSRGTIGFPTRATPEKGAACYARYVESLVEILARPESGRFSRLDDNGSLPPPLPAPGDQTGQDPQL